VASLSLGAAGVAIERGDRRPAVNIPKLVVRDDRRSQEAACARSALDRLARHGR